MTHSLPLFTPYLPAPPLSEFIEMLWHVQGRTPYQREKILPTEHVELIINLDDPHKVFADETASTAHHLNHFHWICGIQTHYILTEAVGNSHLVGVRFKPGGIYPFLGFPVSELRDQIIDLSLIWGREAAHLQEQLLAADDIKTRFALLENALCRRLQADLSGWETVTYAVERLKRPFPFPSIHALSDEIGWSQKHLIQQCKKIVGVSPKLLSRITRFHHVLHTIDPHQPINWADIAHKYHYYDQAHFNRDFHAFSGLTPTDYLTYRQNLPGAPLSKGESVKFVPVQ